MTSTSFLSSGTTVDEIRLTQPVTVIIVNYNGKKDLPDCLDSLGKQTGHEFDLLLFDNASSDGSVDFVRTHYPKVQILVSDDNIGFCEANNVCLRAFLSSASEYAFLLNADTLVDPGCIERLVVTAGREQYFGIFSPKVLNYPDTEKIYYAGGRMDLKRGIVVHKGMHALDHAFPHRAGRTGPVCGCSLLIRKRTLKKIGLLDPAFFAYFEDTDLSMRADKAGEGCYYEPEAVVYHKGGRSYTPHSIYYYYRNRFLFVEKYAKFYHKLYFYPFIIKNQLRAIRHYHKKGDRLMAASLWQALLDGLHHRGGRRSSSDR